jgi:hypothetical protein
MSDDERKTTTEGSHNTGSISAEGNFTGRAQAPEWLYHNLYPGQVLTIHSPGGLGKTAVTNHCLHQLDQSGMCQ